MALKAREPVTTGLKFKVRGKSDKKKVMIYGNDGTGKSTFAEEYCKQNNLKPIVIDVDDTNGKGPETLSVYTKDFEFVYRVTRYSSDRDMTSTRVRVKVYHKDGRQWEFIINNKNNNAKHWNVFKFVNGDVIPLNEYLNINEINIDTGNPGTKITTVPDPVTPEPTTTYINFSDDTLFKQNTQS